MLDDFTPELTPPVPLANRVAAALRRAIVLNTLAPGVHLQEPQLAHKFGVSRMPVREALAQLEHEGLVRGEPHRGTFVVGMSPRDVDEVYDVRRLLEVEAGQLAAERATAETLATLQRLVDEMDRLVRSNQRHLLGRLDITFHRALMTSSGHRRLLSSWEVVAGIAECLLSETDAAQTPLDPVRTHQDIVDALVARDPIAVAGHLSAHLREGARIMHRLLDGAATAAPVAAVVGT
jgi:GntR family transcriptional regulator of gluconate operon